MINYISIGLSNTDINRLVDGKANIVIYGDVRKYKNINQLLGINKACFLLYEAHPGWGHWCLIFLRDDGVLEFFDPYGTFIDDELSKISARYRRASDQDYPHLTKLLYEYKGPIEYNEYPFQEMKHGISTCGRWCVVRLWNRHLNLERFRDIFFNHSGDAIVTKLTYWINT